MISRELYNNYIAILRDELVPAMGCTEPIAIAYAAAKARESLGEMPEKLFVSWTGLRGAVPIILATYPLTEGHTQAKYMFNLIFFVVLTSVMLQGKTLANVAKWLKLDAVVREAKTYPLAFDITPGSGTDETREVDIISEYAVVGHTVSELRFPEGVAILLINRGSKFLIPKGGTVLQTDDTLLLFGEQSKLDDVEKNLTRVVEKVS